MSHNQSPLDSEPICSFVKGLIARGETNASVARAVRDQYGLTTSEVSIRRFRRRQDLWVPGQEFEGDEATVSTPTRQFVREVGETPVLDDPDQMLRDRGLDPEEWFISDGITVNQWDGPQIDGQIVTYYQAKFLAKRKAPLAILQPVRSEGWQRRIQIRRRLPHEAQRVVVCGDQQAPFQDDRLHELFCAFLEEYRPHRGINLGDLMDFPDISRHKDDPENRASAQECMQVGYDLMRGYIDASPESTWDWLPGNHDGRLRNYEIANAPRLYGLRTVDSPEESGTIAYSLEHLLRLDELGVNYIDTHGSYEDGQINLSKNLAVRHGWIVRQGSGASALKTLETTGHSVIVGHTHRQSMVYHTFHEIDGTPRQLLGVETGCMCRIDPRGHRDTSGRRFPNYMTNPNWQQGFATVEIHDDGRFKVDLGTYVNKTLLWRDRRFE